MAIWLCEKADVPIDRYLGLNDIEPFETLLDVSINVVSSRVGNKFVRVTKENTEQYVFICITWKRKTKNIGMVLEAYRGSSMLLIFAIRV